MAFVDEITIRLKAGDGGDGVVRWLHEKFKEFSGPAGGNGGKGGDVIARAVKDLSILDRYSSIKVLDADKGDAGGNRSKEGKNGGDLILELPRGVVITNLKTKKEYRLDNEGDEVLLLHGGMGGFGNEHFKSSTNTTPYESTPGKAGEKATFRIELELTADYGLIGLPSAGKSSLLNALTGAHSKVGEYHFTTLEPHLGAMHGVILADIPGLIEGASKGKGLGHKFLKHIKRTGTLLHCVALDSEDVEKDYNTIRAELEAYSPELKEKPEIILATKSDTVSEEEMKEKIGILKKKNHEVLPITILDDGEVKKLGEELVKRSTN